jgi:S1-C subfamily serine protease
MSKYLLKLTSYQKITLNNWVNNNTRETLKRSIKKTHVDLGAFILLFSLILFSVPIYATQSSNLPISTSTEESLVTVYQNSYKSVVEIFTIWPNKGTAGQGTGFVYGNYIVTNAHVVISKGEVGIVDVTFWDGTNYEAKVLGADTLTDLAVLKLPQEADRKLVSLPIGDSSALKVGERVVAIGSPQGFTSSMATGIISAVGRLSSQVYETASKKLEQPLGSLVSSNPDMIQTDTAINHGNSGGPLLNTRGEVIGVCDLGLADVNIVGINFAIPINTVKKVVPSLITNGKFDHPWLGVGGTSVNAAIARELGLADSRGFLVAGVQPGSPAEKAGIQGGDRTTIVRGTEVTLGGDIIINVDGKPVRSINDILVHMLRNKIVGENLDLTIIRDGQLGHLNVVLEPLPENLKPSL